MGIVLAILVFSFLLMFHELGHFLAARLNHVEVLEFALGMGPTIVSHRWGSTLYSLRAVPFGGFCMMKGENENAGEGSFAACSVWQRIMIVAAGPVFNFLLAWLLSVVLIIAVGYDAPVILRVSEDGPAKEAGLKEGDVILSIDGKRVHFYREVSNYTQFNQKRMGSGALIPITVARDGEVISVTLRPKDDGTGRYVFGYSGSFQMRKEAEGLELFFYAGCEVGYWIDAVFQGLKMLFTGQVGMEDVSGPVGVVSTISTTVEESRQDGAWYVFLNLVNIAILLSANLGVMNLLPIPGLDGGRLLFLLVELVRRRQLKPEMEGKIHLAGLALLMAMMVMIMVSDVMKLA